MGMEGRQSNMYDKLLQLPLFQGMSEKDWSHVVGHTRFDFERLGAGVTTIREGDRCTSICFLIKGQLFGESVADDHSYKVIETYHAPFILQPENLFGLTQRYSQSFTTSTPCELLRINKEDVLKISDNFEVFRINLLNIITTYAQRHARRPWHVPPVTLRGKIIRFVNDRCRIPAGHKLVVIKMEQMATMIGVSRLNLSRELHLMEEEGLIALRRGQIEVFSLQKLL